MYLIKKYISLLAMFAKNSLARQLEYRINFICGILVETGYMIAKVAYVVLIYTTGLEIEGMSADEMLVIIGTYAIVTGIYMSFYPNFVSIGNHVRSGTLDFLIVKPVSTLFILTSRFIDFAMPIPNILAGIVMICVGCRRSHVVITTGRILVYFVCLILAMIITYTLFLHPRLLAFWTVSSGGVSQIADSLWDFNNMPMKIYNRTIQEIGSFFVPVFLITNIPGSVLLGITNKGMILWMSIVSVLLVIIVRICWKNAIKRYSSASS